MPNNIRLSRITGSLACSCVMHTFIAYLCCDIFRLMFFKTSLTVINVLMFFKTSLTVINVLI
jgi:hypothetical protein